MGFLLALSLILSYVESLLPLNFGAPGMKLGLANLCIVILLYMWGPYEALMINLLRIMLTGFLFGSFSMILYSFSGALFSFVCMFLAKRITRLTIGGVSLVGGITHNVAQCVVAAITVNTIGVLYYVPVLLIIGAITGLIIGYIAGITIPLIKRLWRI